MITRKDIKVAAEITIVETPVLAVWLYLGNTAAGIFVLLTGLFVEHLLSRQSG